MLGGGSPGPQKICTQDIVQQLRVAVIQRQYHAVPRIVAESLRGRHHGPRRWRCRPRHGCGAHDGAAAVAANRSMKGPKFPLTAVSKTYAERLEINDCATKRKCSMSFLNLTSVWKGGLEDNRLIRCTALIACVLQKIQSQKSEGTTKRRRYLS